MRSHFMIKIQNQEPRMFYNKFGYPEKATKFEKIFHLKFDTTH